MEAAGGWRFQYAAEVRNLRLRPDVTSMNKSSKVRCVGRVARMRNQKCLQKFKSEILQTCIVTWVTLGLHERIILK